MSHFLGQFNTAHAVLGMNSCAIDESLQPPDYRTSPAHPFTTPFQEVEVLWPRSRMMGSPAPMLGNVENLWEYFWPATGVHRRKVISGVARDSGGNPLAGATVKLFNTATDAIVDTAVANSAGEYSLADPNGVSCYVVAYKAGSPDVAGTTLNTLTGA